MSNRPNLIFIFADQLGLNHTGYGGSANARTPHIDAWRERCVDVSQAVSGYPVCAPFRASLFTGKHTTSTGMVINEIRLNPAHHTCFAQVTAAHGYANEYIGKWHMYANQLGHHDDPRNSFIPPGPDRLGFDGYFAAFNFHHEYYGDWAYYHLDTPEKIFHDKYEPDAQTDMAIERLRLRKQSGEPFSLFLSYGTPHDPWVPENVPPAYYEMFKDVEFNLPENYLPDNDRHADNWAKLSEKERAELTEWMRCYYAMTANLDDNIGRLLAAIEEMGLMENSIIVFTSDHGELFGAHGRRAKNIFYEEAVRVPFLVRWAGHTIGGSSCGACLNSPDIMPTLLSMMNLPIPPDVEGRDFSAALLGGDAPDTGALMMCTGPTAVWGNGNEWRGYRTAQYTYAIFRANGEEHLYDHTADPLQMNNLALDPAFLSTKRELHDAMWREMDRINDRFEANEYYKNNWAEDRVIKRTATAGW